MPINQHLNASLLSFWLFLFVVGRLFYTFATGLGSAPYLITRPVFVVSVINTVLSFVINVLDPVIGVVRVAALTHWFGFCCVRVPFLPPFPVGAISFPKSVGRMCWITLRTSCLQGLCEGLPLLLIQRKRTIPRGITRGRSGCHFVRYSIFQPHHLSAHLFRRGSIRSSHLYGD